VAWLEEAARRDHVEAHFELGLFYEEGGQGPGGRDRAARHYRAAADQGHLEAGYRLAELLRWGIGPARDPGAAHRWYLRSANGGFRPAMEWLVRAFEFGEGVPEDLEKAVYWTVKAQALPPARLRLSHFAKAVPSAVGPRAKPPAADPPEAAPDPGEASFRQGMSYLGGAQGRTPDPIAAGIWLQRAAEAGHVEAMAELAELLAWGVGGLAHSAEANVWFQRAGRAGHQGAQIRLGRLGMPD
jgi:TPR repeat protein